jgi:hypothetical protein
VTKIVNETIVSILLRVSSSRGSKNLVGFLEYMNAFLSWFLSSVDIEFDRLIDIKVKEKSDVLKKKIEDLED